MTTIVRHIDEWKTIAAYLNGDNVLGLVPTMGALHEGHGALLGEARRACSVVVATIFVNPTQFDRKSDYDLYPKTPEDDVAFCASRGVDYVFAPLEQEIYPERPQTFVEVEELTRHLCGQYRPGHFRGVATVVLKLLNIFRPHLAFFGEKDYQQLAIVRRLVRDLNVPVQVVDVPTVREPDGLAMSSRNRRLNSTERALAPRLHDALMAARQSVAGGERSVAAVKERALDVLRKVPEITMEYFDLVDVETVLPVEVIDAPVRAAAAIWIGNTRLIDNVLCVPSPLQNRPATA